MYLTAHTGSDQTPENSLVFANFFKDKEGVDVIEVDVRCNPQGEPERAAHCLPHVRRCSRRPAGRRYR